MIGSPETIFWDTTTKWPWPKKNCVCLFTLPLGHMLGWSTYWQLFPIFKLPLSPKGKPLFEMCCFQMKLAPWLTIFLRPNFFTCSFYIAKMSYIVHKPSWQAFWSPLKQEIAHLNVEKRALCHPGKRWPHLPISYQLKLIKRVFRISKKWVILRRVLCPQNWRFQPNHRFLKKTLINPNDLKWWLGHKV